VVVSEFAPDLLPHRNKNVKGREETVSVSTVFRQFSLTKQIQHQFGNSFCMAIPSAIQFGNSVQQFSSAIRFGNSVWQFSSAIQFGNSVWQFGSAIQFGNSFCTAIRFVKSIWQNEFNLTIRQFSSANRFGILV
jgi:hypothetical protein